MRAGPLRSVWAGFSMIELLIVMALVAVLLTLAAPSYQGAQLRSNRTIAISAMMQTVNCQERLRAVLGQYDTRNCLPRDSEHYQYGFQTSEPGLTRAFTISASARGRQLRDTCGTLRLDELGRRSVSGEKPVSECWSGR